MIGQIIALKIVIKLAEGKHMAISDGLRKYFRGQGFNMRYICERLGYANVQTVQNYISTGKFGKCAADRWAREFGFREEFLLRGTGLLISRESGYQRLVRENMNLTSIVRSQKAVIKDLNKQIRELKNTLNVK